MLAPTPGPFDFDWVSPQLAVGGCVSPTQIPLLYADCGITRVIDVRSEGCDEEELLQAHGIRLLHLPTDDARALPQAMLDQGVAWTLRALRSGERVLIHCEHGAGRSILLLLCVLVAQGNDPLFSLDLTKRVRWTASPNPEQLEAFLEWCARWHSTLGAQWELPSLRDLLAISWRHLTDVFG